MKVFSGSNSEIGKLIFGHLGGSNSEIGKLIFELFRGSNGFQDFVDRRWIEWSEWIELDRIGSNVDRTWIECGSNWIDGFLVPNVNLWAENFQIFEILIKQFCEV